jgi:hypothetical protein
VIDLLTMRAVRIDAEARTARVEGGATWGEVDRATNASECWSVDYDRERRITVTVIGSTSERFIRGEYEAVSRQFFVSPTNFSCKYAGGATP